MIFGKLQTIYLRHRLPRGGEGKDDRRQDRQTRINKERTLIESDFD